MLCCLGRYACSACFVRSPRADFYATRASPATLSFEVRRSRVSLMSTFLPVYWRGPCCRARQMTLLWQSEASPKLVLSGDVRRSVLYLGADWASSSASPEVSPQVSRLVKRLRRTPAPLVDGLEGRPFIKSLANVGLDEGRLFLRWNWARSARFKSTRSERTWSRVLGRVLSSWAKRPWCVGVGVGAVPPRLSSLNIPASFLWGCAWCWMSALRRGAAPPALSWLLDERCDVQTLPPGLGARERCAPGAPCSCPGWAGSVRPVGARTGPGIHVPVGSKHSCGLTVPVPGKAYVRGSLLASDSARAVALKLSASRAAGAPMGPGAPLL